MPGEFALVGAQQHVRCMSCAFVVNDAYFAKKTRFTAGLCPNCGSLVEIYEPYSTEIDKTVEMDAVTGRIVPVGSSTNPVINTRHHPAN